MSEMRVAEMTVRSPLECIARGRVVRLDGWNETRYTPTVTWTTYLDGRLLGNASSEDEGWRWIDDMLQMEVPA